MASALAATTRIFEDADAATRPSRAIKGHKRTPSVGDFLRGRMNKESEGPRFHAHVPAAEILQTPLSERHINSPPPARRVPLRDDETTKPKMHKKTRSNASLKSLIKDHSSSSGSGSMSSSEGPVGNHKPNKSKSSANLVTLFRRKPKRDILDQSASGQENISPPPSANSDIARSPIRAQFECRSPEGQVDNVHCSPGKRRTVEEEIHLYIPKGFGDHPVAQQDLPGGVPSCDHRPLQRPFSEQWPCHRMSCKEELEDGTVAQQNRKQEHHSTSSQRRPPIETQAFSFPQPPEFHEKRSSRILAMSGGTKAQHHITPASEGHDTSTKVLSEDEVKSALESLLDARNIAPNMRNQMRALDTSMKMKLIQNQRGGSGSSTSATTTPTMTDYCKREKSGDRPNSHAEREPKEAKQSRPRPRSRAFTLTKRSDSASPTKKQKGEDLVMAKMKARPLSMDMSPIRPNSARSLTSSTSITSLFSSKPDTAAVPGDFIHYLREIERPELIEIGKMHKLRILLRNESISWTDTFVKSGGMDEVVNLLYRIIQVQWREEHEDSLLHETLLCLKGLCTTSLALQRLAEIEGQLFPKLLGMLFDEEKKGPSEFSTRCIILFLLFAHLSASLAAGGGCLATRARTILSFLQDPTPEEAKKPFDFIEQMHVSRPYRVWCKEVVNVTKEVFWIFLHHLNVIPITGPVHHGSNPSETFADRHFPPPRPPHPAAPYVGGVEWEATTYLATHLDLLNGLIASLPTQGERNGLRQELRVSGWEKAMGGTMRKCKEKFYGGVHDGLKVWVAAARDDGWPVEDVRAGPPRESSSPRKPHNSPVKKREIAEEPPKIRLDIGIIPLVGGGGGGGGAHDSGHHGQQPAWI